ncbi:MAG TPA: HAMP domain-containing sensor histidine kinase [Candidatus Limnocylindrales bacterium]|nr:HAMP domain-containing sensor histidine kinase [Candidatus Limnocylindrales bacterium]
MRIRWSAFEAIFRDFSDSSQGKVSFFIDDEDGNVLAGTVSPDRPSEVRHRLTADGVPVGRLNGCGGPTPETMRLCWAACERELAHQVVINDMADATARLWRQTNALLRMSASTSLALEPGAMLGRVLGVLAHSTNLQRGCGLLRVPGDEAYSLFGLDRQMRVNPSSIPALEDMNEDVVLIDADGGDVVLAEECERLLGRRESLAVTRIATDKDRYGYLLVPFRRQASITSEDLKMLGAAAQIVSIAAENVHTLRREREATRLQVENEMLSAQARDMEEMVHVVSHDLRSPMTAMYGFMHMALEELEHMRSDGGWNERGERIAKPLEDGVRSVEKLNRMVQRLLDFSRVARLDYHFEPLEMTKLVQGVLDSLSYQIRERGIQARVEELPDVMGDRVQVEAVFRNLIDNAIKYMGEGARRSIVIGSRSVDGELQYFVRDTGMGMSADQAAKAFLPFRRFRVDAAPGEGIGLSYVRKIVERHGGHISCESAEGVGTTFYFSLGRPAQRSLTSAVS